MALMNNTDSNILETQLLIGKEVLEIILDLVSDKNKEGTVLPLDMNGKKFTITVEKD
jgi:hypothetical protein